ncbi:hypothetical protein PM082_020941 [Marasmius tenuissimus]|nr:hypothetical protein PM082_020941 [Marasmius tenuissimus]
MVHRSSDSRLLNNLISHEKEYSKHLHALLDSSHASFNSLTAFAASSPPPTSQIILAIAGSLNSVDDALRGYVVAVERWRQYLADLKDLEDEVGNIMRDREILVTRLLKASAKSKPSSNRDSMLQLSPQAYQSSSTLGSYDDPTSMTYLPTPTEQTNSYFSAPANKKLQAAQSELQACEAHLAIKEHELDVKRTGAVREGLQTRFHALSECGHRWAQVGKDVEVYLYGQSPAEQRAIASASPRPVFSPVASPPPESKPLPMPDLPVIHTPIPIRPAVAPDAPNSDLSHSSIAPSQSASQVGTIVPPSPTTHIYINSEAQPPSDQGSTSSIPSQQYPASASASSSLFMPKRHVLPHRITEEDLVRSSLEQQEQGGGSSDEEVADEPMRVVENPRYNPGRTSSHDIGKASSTTSSSPRKEKGGSGFLGSIRGLFTRHGKEGSVNSAKDDDDESAGGSSLGNGRGRKKARKPLFTGKEKDNRKSRWETRIEGNIRELTRDEAVLATRPFPGRRASEDMVASGSSPAIPARARVLSDSSPKVSGKRLKKKNVSQVDVAVLDEKEEGIKKKRRRSASFDPTILREQNIAELGGQNEGLSRAEEWVDSQKTTPMEAQQQGADDTGPPSRKSSVKRKSSAKRKESGDAAPTSSPSAPANPVLLHQSGTSKEEDIYLVPVTSEGTLSRSASTASAARSRSATTHNTSSSGLQRTGSNKSKKRRASSMDQQTRNANITTLHTNGAPQVPPVPTSPPTPKAQKRASAPVTFGTKTSGSHPSLMSIVEDVAKANREAWNGPSAHGNPVVVKSIGGTVKPVGLVDMEVVKAPKSVSLKDLEAINMSPGTSASTHLNRSASASSGLFLPKAPSLAEAGSSVHSLPEPPATAIPVITTTPSTPRTDHVHFQRRPSPPPVTPSQPRKQVLPLKSALKGGGSRTPSPLHSASTPSPPLQPSGKPTNGNIISHTLHTEPSITLFPLPSKSLPESNGLPIAPIAPIPTQPLVNGIIIPKQPVDDDDDDAASISSYETGHEVFNGSSGDDTETERGPPTPPPPPPPPSQDKPQAAALPNGIGNGNGNAITADLYTPSEDSQAQVPRRRKSVRVSLRPTFSPTPPAIEDDEEPSWETQAQATAQAQERNEKQPAYIEPTPPPKRRGYGDSDGGVRDMWNDSSEDEDNEYTSARRLLSKLGKKRG